MSIICHNIWNKEFKKFKTKNLKSYNKWPNR